MIMIIKFIPPNPVDTAVHQLPEPDMAVDPRPIKWTEEEYKFELAVNGTVLTLTKVNIEDDESTGWDHNLAFRVYSSNEFHYSFESTKYLYHDIDGEYAPEDVTEIVVKDGVETIKEKAFEFCGSLSKITIPGTITSIQSHAFYVCHSLRCIQLPPNLQYIGQYAFAICTSLEAIYIPPTVTKIDCYAFKHCNSLRIINIPDSFEGEDFVYDDIYGCNDLMTPHEAQGFTTHQEFCEWFRNRYNPLHSLCWDPSVTVNNIQQYIQTHHDDEERATTNDKPQFAALHLLAANPSVTGELITAYLHLAPDVATMQDNKDKTPLHMLCSVPLFVDGTGSAIEAYIGGCDEWKKAAFIKDDEGRTPLECLFEKKVDELLFLENKTFAGLMVWWYDHCLGISLFSEGIARY